ncbi:hypothetical protein [Motiliproteus sp. SC1-56]|uniref:hypothetical protein n=1 Tax=Motiliproteus sp. SC1-56 TaxID=2799565 RepID=UPI001A8E47FC|nr:hypothetical protein [Motiliproteus sp. SC1-56]
MKRREAKEKHEQSVLHSFEKYLLNKGVTLKIIGHPEPPDALVNIDGKETWVEITDAFLNEELARSISSYPADDVPHIHTKRKLIIDPEQIYEGVVQDVVLAKYNKNAIRNVYKMYAQGILLVGLFSPFVDIEDIEDLVLKIKIIKNGSDNRFGKIYLYDRDRNFHKI